MAKGAAAELSDRELRLLRMRAQRLLPGSEVRTVARAASGTLAIQAQDVAGATLSIRARTAGLTAERVRQQTATGSTCRSWLMRNTIFLFASADLAWMRPLLAERPLVPAMRRLAQEGVDEATVEAVLERLARLLAEGPLPRSEAIAAIRSMGIEPGENNQRTYWLIHVAALRGVLVVSPALDRKQVFVPAPDPEPLDRDKGLGRLARRFLKAYGPATREDFAYFFKATKADASRAWEGAGRTIEVETERGPMTALSRTLDVPAIDAPVVRLLASWDHFLLGWRDRSLTMPATDAEHARQPSGYPTAFADGRAFGVWRIRRVNEAIEAEVEPFDRVPRGAKTGLEAEVADLGRFLETTATLRLVRP